MDPKTKDILNRPFDRAQIKERKGPNGRMLSYVAIGDYIARLNEAFDGGWTYEITETKLLDDEAIVQVRLTAAGMIKMGMGGASITRRRDNGKPVSIAHDVMAAEASALKRACRLLGIGAALYLDDEEPVPSENHDRRNTTDRPAQYEGETPSSSPRITNAQIGKLRSLVAERGGDWRAYRASVRERHQVNVEYADRRLASTLIQELLESAGSHNRGNGHGNDSNGWRRS
jgi:hypothetical protein